MKKCIQLVLLPLLFLSLRPINLSAQATASGNVQGTVSDSSGAVVSGAEVSITSMSTGAQRSQVTNNSGTFRFDLLSAGRYKVTVASRGFSSVAVNLEILVGQTSTANVSLAPGAASQTVEVTGVNPLIDVQKTSVAQKLPQPKLQICPWLVATWQTSRILRLASKLPIHTIQPRTAMQFCRSMDRVAATST